MSIPAQLGGPYVDAAWLEAHLDAVRVVDVRWYLDGRSGLEAYQSGHVPGAVFVDLDSDLAAPAGPIIGRHPLPTPEHFATAMGRLGITNEDTVIAYDDASGSVAARLWWMLDAVGVRVAVLDGGLAAWTGAFSLEMARPTSTAFTPRSWPSASVVDADEVDRLRLQGAPLLDARPHGRFTGEAPSIDLRPGHIPGARSAPWASNLDPGTGKFLPPAELRRRYQGLGIDARDRVVVSCGSGVTACHDLLALRVAGFENAALYPGSWSGWSSDPLRPIALGAR
jgi:thiosulfate/3-mercaptopyruvate sulfurtransferase